MASESVNVMDAYDRGTILLTASKAMVEMIGIAGSYSPSNGIPHQDAAWGVCELLEQAREAFREAHAKGVAP